jgi:hypothetical protein
MRFIKSKPAYVVLAVAVVVAGIVWYPEPRKATSTAVVLAPGLTPSAAPASSPNAPSSPPSAGPAPGMGGMGGMRTMAVIDLNTATVEQLQTLPEITADYARKIVAGRPYTERKDLERAGIPHDVAERLGPPAVIKSAGPAPAMPKGPRK